MTGSFLFFSSVSNSKAAPESYLFSSSFAGNRHIVSPTPGRVPRIILQFVLFSLETLRILFPVSPRIFCGEAATVPRMDALFIPGNRHRERNLRLTRNFRAHSLPTAVCHILLCVCDVLALRFRNVILPICHDD